MRAHAFFDYPLHGVSGRLHTVAAVAAVLFGSVPVGGTPAAGDGSAERGPGAGAAR